MERHESNEFVETAKNVGFTCVAVIGWLAWIPTALGAILFYVILALLITPAIGSVVRYIGIDAAKFLAAFVILVAGLVCGLLNMIGVPVNIDYRKLNPGQIPGLLFGSMFRLVKPNRFTFVFGCITIVYVAVVTLPVLLRR